MPLPATLLKLRRALLPALLLTGLACSGRADATDLRAGAAERSASTLVIGMPAQLGSLERPAVQFDHGKHTDALAKEGCTTCHATDSQGRNLPVVKGAQGAANREAFAAQYHAVCMGCHKERLAKQEKAGPLACGDCHAKREEAPSQFTRISWDYSLHARHSKASKDACEKCHHAYDEAAKKLVYVKGKEEACSDCHKGQDQGKTLSLRNASHLACVGCHVQAAARKEKTGPALCASCHTKDAQAKFERLADAAPIARGQPAALWMSVEGAKANRVPFDHKTHEKSATSCSTCHHNSLETCHKCHTLAGDAAGGHITTEQASHDKRSARSCVGCHARQAVAQKACAQCHGGVLASVAANPCGVCHRDTGMTTKADGALEYTAALPELALLPPVGESFPEKITMGALKEKYAPAEFPHAAMVVAIDKEARKSRLASSFHQTTALLCAGCHHHSPVGARPAPCRACHSLAGDSLTDRPGLRAAYHRQCMGCHERGVAPVPGARPKPLDCTGCHALAKQQEAQR